MNLTSIYLPKLIGNAISAPIPSKNLKDRVRRYIRFILDEQLLPACETEKIVANHLKSKYIKNKISQYQSSQNSDLTSENIVWQYWAQGIESSPEIIKICLESVNSYFSKHGYKVIQLNDKNINKYLDINPSYFKKASTERNGFSIAALSDLIRLGLLYNYGGIWCDATVFISGNPYYLIENNRVLFERNYQVKFKERLKYAIGGDYFRWGKDVRVNWLSSIIKTPKHDILMHLLWDILNEYWNNENTYEHYFLCHILFDEIKNREGIKNYSYLSLSDTDPHALQSAIAKNAQISFAKKIMKETPIHKLTHKFPPQKSGRENNLLNKFIQTNGTLQEV
ncbi:MAG: hypothetical protein EGR87_05805 [Sutterella wadsworthensis]|uniref:capsular polysaccharide synthesis protein n=1 Tax=Sutterella wadsworthensis TaxID=40545 RepID=UPI001EB744A6|nr:capsular polysaccharide synthesis protein [Sutterella wadsworthensis]MBD8910903.1 hypothetical protein [Sutterella wadsworthensis]